MKHILRLLPVVAATPALAHEIEAAHSHLGETVLFNLSPLLILGAGMAALIAVAILHVRGGKEAGGDRHDPR